jgi:hypothetical protein
LTIDFAAEGFLQHTPGREYRVQGHEPENTSGLLTFGAVVAVSESDDIIELGTKQGLQLHSTFDDAHPGLVLLEAVGEVNLIEQLAKDLGALGFHRLPAV